MAVQDLPDAERSIPASGDQSVPARRKPPVHSAKFVAGVRVSGPSKRVQQVETSGLGIKLHFGEAENPHYTRAHHGDRTNPRMIPVARNVNESALVRLEATGAIDPAQARAGHMFRALFERMMAGQGSPSFIQERVDGSSAPDIFTDSRMRASIQLREAATQMTESHYRALIYVCGEGHSMNDLARKFQVRKRTARDVLKDALDKLAELWDLSTPKGHAPKRA